MKTCAEPQPVLKKEPKPKQVEPKPPSTPPSSPPHTKRITRKAERKEKPLKPPPAINSDDEEIEEGEMLDFSSSGSSDGEAEEAHSPPKRPLFDQVGVETTPLSPASSHFSSSSEGEESADLPSFFTVGREAEEVVEKGPIVVHLPDFEVGFISERPPLPKIAGGGSKDYAVFM